MRELRLRKTQKVATVALVDVHLKASSSNYYFCSEKNLAPWENTMMRMHLLYDFEGSEAAFHVVSAAATPAGRHRRGYWHGKVPGKIPHMLNDDEY